MDDDTKKKRVRARAGETQVDAEDLYVEVVPPKKRSRRNRTNPAVRLLMVGENEPDDKPHARGKVVKYSLNQALKFYGITEADIRKWEHIYSNQDYKDDAAHHAGLFASAIWKYQDNLLSEGKRVVRWCVIPGAVFDARFSAVQDYLKFNGWADYHYTYTPEAYLSALAEKEQSRKLAVHRLELLAKATSREMYEHFLNMGIEPTPHNVKELNARSAILARLVPAGLRT